MNFVTFYTAVEKDLRRAARFDPDRDWEEFAGGAERVWILQTYLRLKGAGYPVQISSDIPGDGIVVLHRQSELEYFSRRFLRFPITVTTNADTGVYRWADAEIVQDPTKAAPGRAYYVPFWPQPGLLPRSQNRGSVIHKVGFKGSHGRLDPAFTSDDWLQFLRHRNVEWDYDVRIQDAYGVPKGRLRWNNYSDLDLVIGLGWLKLPQQIHKPPNRLVNAWLAGVPAILGPEPAFRALRRSELDYIEVETYEDAKRAVDFLLNHPDRYEAMIDNGRKRAAEFTTDRIVRRWAEVLFEVLPRVLRNWRSRLARVVPVRMRRKFWNAVSPSHLPSQHVWKAWKEIQG